MRHVTWLPLVRKWARGWQVLYVSQRQRHVRPLCHLLTLGMEGCDWGGTRGIRAEGKGEPATLASGSVSRGDVPWRRVQQ